MCPATKGALNMDVAMKHTPEGQESHEWFPEGLPREVHTKSLHGQKLQLLVSGLGCGGAFELIRKTHMESFSSKFVFTGKGANSPSRGHLQRESPDTLEKPQRTVEP